MHGISRTPAPRNEPVTPFAPGTPERKSLKACLKSMASETTEVPLYIGDRRVTPGGLAPVLVPHDHQKTIAQAHSASVEDVQAAIAAAEAARPAWSALPYEARASIILRAADLLAGPWRDRMNASTMLGQSKTCHQAEIDASCELIDFWRFNARYGEELMREQPDSQPGMWNRVEMRPLDGFVFAVSPFNFTSIAANLPTAPALMGNTVVWKPSPTQMFSAYITMELLEAAGMPPGVVNLVAGDPAMIGDTVLSSPRLGGIHFTGSTRTFQHLWSTVGKNIQNYGQYPRIVGETGGKDFIFAHASADPQALLTAIVRGGYEFQGQKCSAASRIYVPKSVWKVLEAPLVETIRSVKMGDVADFENFMGAVIDDRAFKKISAYIDYAKDSASSQILAGGEYDDSKGYFIPPTLVQALDPNHKLMCEEIFGPVVTLFVYDDDKMEETLDLCDTASPYGLTGAVFSQDRYAAERVMSRLRHTAGNFYINDKPTGAVVGQQPFGGSRASGTNDKAGSPWNLLRWVSPRSIKETFVPATDYRYPFMAK